METTPRNAVSSRGHRGARDLAALRMFASDALRTRAPLDAAWHPGNIVWDLQNTGGKPQHMRLWEGPDGLVAVAWFQSPGELWIECLPDSESLFLGALAWGEAAVATRGPDISAMSVRALKTDIRRIEGLQARGYHLDRPDMAHFRRALDDGVPAPELPPGMRLRDCVDVDPEARAKCHRDAWNHLEHIGLPQARSQFSTESYKRLRLCEGYDPTLDLMVEAQDGTLAASCICWADLASGVGTFEPVGTHVAFRGRGLARAVVTEGLCRLRAKGLEWARVGTAHFNRPAIAAYLSCGFDLLDETAWWRQRTP